MLVREIERLYVIQASATSQMWRSLLGVCVSSAVAQLRVDKTSAADNSFGKFICVMTGYAGGESTSHIAINRPSPGLYFR
jgi:hypothetical protein